MGIKWRTSWKTGITKIDDQHKKLVEIINKLLVSRYEHKEDSVLKEIMTDLVNYTRVHFKDEEEFYESHKFSGILEHKAQHRVLVNQLIHILEEMRDGKFTISEELSSILQNWLIKHVLNYDIHAVKECLES